MSRQSTSIPEQFVELETYGDLTKAPRETRRPLISRRDDNTSDIGAAMLWHVTPK
jgi:hypothetical protein